MRRVFARIEDLVPGQVLYDYHMYIMDNTSIRAEGCWYVRVLEVDLENRMALCYWDTSNRERWCNERQIKKFRLAKKEAKL